MFSAHLAATILTQVLRHSDTQACHGTLVSRGQRRQKIDDIGRRDISIARSAAEIHRFIGVRRSECSSVVV